MRKETKQSTASKATSVNDPEYGPLVVIDPQSRFPFRFGIAKARKIVEHYTFIKKFVEDNKDAK